MSDSKLASRRNFLKGTTAAAAGLTLTSLARTAHAAGSDTIKSGPHRLRRPRQRGHPQLPRRRPSHPRRRRGRRLRGPATGAAKSLNREQPERRSISPPTTSSSGWTPIRRPSTAAST